MPRFAANLSFLFHEVAFVDRFAAAAQAGFRAVEFAFGYDYPAQELAARARANGLAQVLINAPPGDWAAGDRGLAALPGREHEFAAAVVTALRYAQTLSCPRVHVMAGVVAATRSRAPRAPPLDLRAQPALRGARGGRAGRRTDRSSRSITATFRRTF